MIFFCCDNVMDDIPEGLSVYFPSSCCGKNDQQILSCFPRSVVPPHRAGQRAVVCALSLDGVVDAIWCLALDLESSYKYTISAQIFRRRDREAYQQRRGRSPC